MLIGFFEQLISFENLITLIKRKIYFLKILSMILQVVKEESTIYIKLIFPFFVFYIFSKIFSLIAWIVLFYGVM